MNSEIYQELNKKYKEEILPKFKILETERSDALKTRNFTFIVGIILIIFIFLSKVNSLLMLLFVFIAFSMAFGMPKVFETRVKEKIMRYFCSCFEDLSWTNSSKMTKENKFHDFVISESKLLKASKLFYTDNSSTFYYDDIFKGSYDNIPFLFYELSSNTHLNKFYSEDVRLFDISDMLLPKAKRNIKFNGLVIKVKLNKKFKGNTIVVPDSMFHLKPDSKLRRTVLEDVKFERKFDVFTTDEVEARYLITTSFMERLNKLSVVFKADKVSCAFYNKELFIGIHIPLNKDLFKVVNLNKPLDDNKEIKNLLKEVILIYDLIDYLKLKEKTKL